MKIDKNPQLVAVGRKIRALREELGLTQEEFASTAGLDRSYYGGIERGDRNVSLLNLIRIAIALNKDVSELFPPLNHLSNL